MKRIKQDEIRKDYSFEIYVLVGIHVWREKAKKE